MTFAAVASLSQTIHLILNNHQDSISHEFKSKITSLHEHIIFLQSFLEESPDETHRWEARIRKVTNEAEDIIELFLSDLLLDSAAGSSRSKLKRGNCELRYDLDELEKATKEIESIAKEVRERHSESVGSSDGQLMQIIDRLCGGPRDLEVIPIVGIGGIGKTTLAAAVYNHPLVVNTFERRGWVTVSKNHSWNRVILELVLSVGIFEVGDSHDDKLLKTLSGKRYLIVLDDLWNVELWRKIVSLIPINIKGSRIVITTRQLDVARLFRFDGHIHEMCSMNVNQSWNLLRRKVFKGADCPPNLAWMGKMIAESCRGIPLAIEAVSGILGADPTLAAWEDVADNINDIDCEADDEHVLRILWLSYAYLPPHLRPCLLYFGIFPEGQEISTYKLLPLWEAEGFVNDSESESIEGIGEKYLEDLAVKRNLVRVTKRKNVNGRIRCVSVHDMVREMCIRQARADKFCLHVGRNIDLPVKAIELERRLGIYENNHGILENVNGSTIRTIICFEGNQQGFRELLGCSRLLRILDFSHAPHLRNKIDLGEELFELFHLRYLAFYYVSRIPKAISKLENLQTLIIHAVMDVELPEEVWRMRQLRRVSVCYRVGTQSIDLENMEMVTKAIDLNGSRLMLKMRPKPLFTLTFRSLECWQILKVEAIRLMRIVIYRFLKMKPAFHPWLKTLRLSGLGLPWEYMSIVASLPKLGTLQLENVYCSGSTWKTNQGGFRNLEGLIIHDSNLKNWIIESRHFPKLKFLKLSLCCYLREIPIAMGHIPTLMWIELDLVGMNSSSLLDSAKRIQHQQRSLGYHFFQLRFPQPPTSHFGSSSSSYNTNKWF